MTGRLQVDADRGSLTLVVRGPFRLKEVEAALAEAGGSEPAELAVVLDLRGADFSPSPGECQSLARVLRDRLAPGRERGGLLVSGDLAYGLARMTSIYGDTLGVEVAAFRNEDRLRAWLAGRSAPVDPPAPDRAVLR